MLLHRLHLLLLLVEINYSRMDLFVIIYIILSEEKETNKENLAVIANIIK